ncbi:MAG: AzlD domain-containing protein [Proteobacteria bacterium]|nr:AzlD domain-containing protein [Pseudomonadota bacterium]
MQNDAIFLPIVIMASITFFTRLLPFLFFRGKQPPDILGYLEKHIPPMILLLLVIYCIKDVSWGERPYGLPELISIAIVAAAHLWKSNALLSICVGTVVYMILAI